MQKSNDDCFYFLTSSCTKGPTCTYRHNPSVLTCNVMCPAWLRGNCINPSCTLRHSAIQCPTSSNGISCFYENSSMGCLKPDCIYVHLRPRPHLRNSSTVRSSATNLINKDAIKTPILTNSASIEPVPCIPVSLPSVETPTIPEIPPLVAVKSKTPPRRIAISAEDEQKEVIAKNIVLQSSEETKIALPVTGNRNVVIGEAATVSSRTVVHRVVVSADTTKSPKKVANHTDSDSDLDDLVEQEDDTKNVKPIIDIPFPCSAPSITNRLLKSSKPITPTNSTKPIRLNRDHLPAAKIAISNSTSSIHTPSNGEKTSAGTGLSQDDERRTSRIERFKKQPTSPPRSVVNSTRSVINCKRSAPEQSIEESPPTKRLSSQQDPNYSHHQTSTIGDLCSPPPPPPSNSRRSHERHRRRRRSSSSSRSRSRSRSPPRKSPPSRSTYPSTSSMNETAWKKQVDEFLARTTQPKATFSTRPIQRQPVPLLSLRPRYVPPPLLSLPHVMPRPPISNPRPRQSRPTTTPRRRPSAPVIASPSNPVEQTPTKSNSTPIVPSKDDEDLLLESDEPSDVVDTFALIDEALLGVDEFLELM
ncbi:hypothetical protein I4U23_014649 [Adineta vaga]|nr:hypothetical protein I4U23_014649 [Adineta vaga]